VSTPTLSGRIAL